MLQSCQLQEAALHAAAMECKCSRCRREHIPYLDYRALYVRSITLSFSLMAVALARSLSLSHTPAARRAHTCTSYLPTNDGKNMHTPAHMRYCTARRTDIDGGMLHHPSAANTK